MLDKELWDLLVEDVHRGIKEQSEMIVKDSSASLPQRGLPSRGKTLHDTGRSNAKPYLQTINGKAQSED